MEALIRQLAVLAAMWALCELLLPDGRQQRMVRMAVSLMVTAALVTTLGQVLGNVPCAPMPVLSAQTASGKPSGYDRIALVSLANQVESYCVRLAKRAGYQAEVAVYLHGDGSVERIELQLAASTAPLMEKETLLQTMADQLSLNPDKLVWQP